MKRDRRLRDLSDDHHQALVLARRATRAAVGNHVLFAAIQETLGDDGLDAVADACRKRKIDGRPTDTDRTVRP